MIIRYNTGGRALKLRAIMDDFTLATQVDLMNVKSIFFFLISLLAKFTQKNHPRAKY